ncbi:acyltransferase family protein [Hansschlegelia quercus]|uniref:acyltransferase family protein n=1 Tax=Hansschlegelia quercus TaxID=2528245 RepID=UPI0013EF38F4|nr:acyltransferase [Hansschlegelia quercus]
MAPRLQGRFEALDGWRGVCALLVAAYHFNPAAHSMIGPLLRNAYIFVDFFFVLSGFVICHTYGDKLRSVADLTPFMIRRFARLYPLHLAILLIYVAIECARWAGGAVDSGRAPFAGSRSVATLLGNLTLTQSVGFFNDLSWNGPAWSISVEFWTYVAFALLVLAAGRFRVPVFAAVAVGALVALFATGVSTLNVTADFGLLRCLAGFFLGALVRIFLIGRAAVDHGASSAASSRQATLIEAATLVGALAFVTFAGDGRWSIAAPIVFAGVVAVFAHGRGLMSRGLASPPLVMLGALSYAVYMIHALGVYALTTLAKLVEQRTGAPLTERFVEHGNEYVIMSLPNAWAMDLATLMFLAGTLVAAMLLRRFVELPGQTFVLFALLGRPAARAPVDAPLVSRT